MKKKLKTIFGVVIAILIITGIGVGTYLIAFSSSEDPSFELPVHNLDEVTGIQVYHDNRSTQLHVGFDFKLENDTEIFAPISGTVSNVKKDQMSNGYWMIVINI
ncbi:MAG: hypothetical protein GF317_03665, partial [Candidatus Lokiarchaeota archaeon]|nr:hypothetical protein [Candidatus Lokiarchaeota archaeon]MBD3198985.1 hypothetical protein [Candidatus Lokiarchaeota archaeon]